MNKLCIVALAASLCAASAMAIEGPAAFVPAQSGATYPGTATPATAWKLVGSLGASAVQIAPRWLLTARHVGVGVAVGQTFTNGYGSATVSAVVLGNNVDMALVYLSSAITVPANELPLLLSDNLNADNNNLPGQMLAAGRGGFGPVKAHWLQANEDSSATVLASGVEAIGGDSGSGVFWYPQAGARPVLRSITATAGNPVGPFQFLVGTGAPLTPSDQKTWITNTIASYGANAGAAPQWTTSVTQSPLASRTPNLPETPKVLQTRVNGAWLQWSAPKPSAAGVPAATGYVIKLSPGGAEYNVPASQDVLTIQGLPSNTTYTATVAAVNANGPSGRRVAKSEADGVTTDRNVFQTSLAPNAFAALTYEAYTYPESGQLKSCVRFNPTFASTGVPATTFGITNYQLGNTSVLNGISPTVDYCKVQPGVSSAFFVAPWNRLTPGPSQVINITPPAAPTGVPTNLVAKGLIIDGDRFLNFNWTKPNTPQPTATLTGYGVNINCMDADGVTRYNLGFNLAANITNWTVSMVPAGTDCSVLLTAKWSRAIPRSHAFASAAIPQ